MYSEVNIPKDVKISWDKVIRAENYEVYIDNNCNQTTTNECTFNLLINGYHNAVIVAKKDNKDIGYAGFVNFEVINTQMKNIDNVYLVSCEKIEGEWSSSYKVKIGWDIPESTTQIIKYIVKDINSEYEVNTNSYERDYMSYICETVSNGVITGKELSITVKVIYETGISEVSEPFIFNPYLITDIKDINKDDFKIYPNPATEVIFFSENVITEIYSLTGSLLLKSNEFNDSFYINSLQTGSYIIKIKTESGSEKSQILIIK